MGFFLVLVFSISEPGTGFFSGEPMALALEKFVSSPNATRFFFLAVAPLSSQSAAAALFLASRWGRTRFSWSDMARGIWVEENGETREKERRESGERKRKGEMGV